MIVQQILNICQTKILPRAASYGVLIHRTVQITAVTNRRKVRENISLGRIFVKSYNCDLTGRRILRCGINK